VYHDPAKAFWRWLEVRIVQLSGWKKGARKVSAIAYVRGVSGKNLAEAKKLIEAVLDGETVEVEVHRVFAKYDVVEDLREFGFEAHYVSGQ